jgi:hypothetical protein
MLSSRALRLYDICWFQVLNPFAYPIGMRSDSAVAMQADYSLSP